MDYEMKKFYRKISRLPEEYWWGGATTEGIHMPIAPGQIYSIDLTRNDTYNQAGALFVSNKGRWLWSSKGYRIRIEKEAIVIEDGGSEILYGDGNGTLKGALQDVKSMFFSAHSIPPEIMFHVPQYCTWIELMYNQNQKDILAYAKGIIESGLPAGELIIDDCWQEYNGGWRFHAGRFPDPKNMVKELHDMGFQVLLWISPFISPDTIEFRELEGRGVLLRDKDGELAIRKWWNGYSAVLDLSNPEAVKWFEEQTDRLIREYGVDGFKQDAGDAMYYENTDLFYDHSCDPNGQSSIWAELALKYPYNELRACFNNSGKPIVQRLCDKRHLWDSENGLGALVPSALLAGVLGYYYICPDMIGGGQFTDFVHVEKIDLELFIRSCECSAMMPMMQFSYAIWKHKELSADVIVAKYAHFHEKMGDTILELARHTAQTGEPIIRYMEYEFPNQGFEEVNDQFMLGSQYLVAPVVTKGATVRKVRLPLGRWQYDYTGEIYDGGQTVLVDAPLEILPWFSRL